MRPKRRLTILLLALAGIAALVIFDTPESPSTPASRKSPSRISPPSGNDMILALSPRAAVSNEGVPDAFGVRDWTPPPPPPPPAPPPAPPQAPSLPFSYLGKQLLDGHWTVFLGQQDKTYIVQVGDVIGDAYKIERIAPPHLTLTYLPLKQAQTLAIGIAE